MRNFVLIIFRGETIKNQTRLILGSVFLISAAVFFQNCSQTEFDSGPVSPANVSANSSLDQGINICAAPIPASFGIMACANGLSKLDGLYR